MRTRFDEQLEQLNMLLIDMGALCEEAINYAVGALQRGIRKNAEADLRNRQDISTTGKEKSKTFA